MKTFKNSLKTLGFFSLWLVLAFIIGDSLFAQKKTTKAPTSSWNNDDRNLRRFKAMKLYVNKGDWSALGQLATIFINEQDFFNANEVLKKGARIITHTKSTNGAKLYSRLFLEARNLEKSNYMKDLVIISESKDNKRSLALD